MSSLEDTPPFEFDLGPRKRPALFAGLNTPHETH